MARPRNDGTPYKAKQCTIPIKKDIVHQMQLGKTYSEIITKLQDEYGYTANSARDMYSDCKALLDEKYKLYVEDVAKRNIERLNALVEKCDEQNRYSDEIKAIDLLSKISGLYKEKIQIETKEPIRITFN